MELNLEFRDVVTLLTRILVAHGYDEPAAEILATNCAAAQRDGSVSHGIFRMQHYIDSVRSGYVNGKANPVVTDVSPGLIRVDADNGFAPIAIASARNLLIEKTRKNGIAALAVRNSHHLGALYLDVEPFAEEGLIALAMVNSAPAVAPHGGHKAVFGTNPIAFAAPRANSGPLVFDQATSTMAYGDVQVAHKTGQTLPPNSGVDKHGKPTCSPQEILDGGALLNFGGYKGATISLMVEILCAAFVGADFSHEVDWSGNPGAITARSGETLILIDPALGADGLKSASTRVDVLIDAIKDAGQSHIPGERRLRNRESMGQRILIAEPDLQDLQSMLLAA